MTWFYTFVQIWLCQKLSQFCILSFGHLLVQFALWCVHNGNNNKKKARKKNLGISLWIHKTSLWQQRWQICSADNIGCLSLLGTLLEEGTKKGWQCSLVGRWQAWEALGLFIRKERCSDNPVVHRCKMHEPKPTQNTDSTASVSENTHSPSWCQLSRLTWFPASIHLI